MQLSRKPDKDNTYCVSPHNEVHVDQEGRIGFCCIHKGFVGNIRDMSIKEAFTSEQYKLARAQSINNEPMNGCELCINGEKATTSGMRYNNYAEFKSMTKFQPGILRKIKIDFSNACNLRCTMCSPHRSTGWYKDAKVLDKELGDEVGRAIFNPKGREYGLSDNVVDDNLQEFLNCELIDVSGGEPFYTPQFNYLVDKLIEHKYKGQLKIITNLTLVKPNIIEKLKKLNTKLIVSMDGINELYEYMRPSTPFGKYKSKEITDRILHNQHHFDIGISYTPQLLNLYNIAQFARWADQHILAAGVFNSPLAYPRYLRLSVHPDVEYKELLANYIEEHFSLIHCSSLVHSLRVKRTEQDEKDWIFFCKTTEILDKQRKTSILNYIPKLKTYWNTST